jgi:phospholipid/cholesterol/gamma-HCH transport system permease protein
MQRGLNCAMTEAVAEFTTQTQADAIELCLRGDWRKGTLPRLDDLRKTIEGAQRLRLLASDDFAWDSQAMTRLFHLARHCQQNNIALDITALPEGMQKLLDVATAVKPQTNPPPHGRSAAEKFRATLRKARDGGLELVEFVGAATIAFGRLLTGRAHTRVRDIFYFMEQCGPQALGIVGLISVLVGMILAYLGSVQLKLFGAEVYVANLVAIGMVREMGALMTAVIMAGRTGAAYAAQLGAMQANEEVDAITTLGLSPMEYLVLPRLLALICVMPLLCVFANVLGLAGGAMVAAGMDVNFTQFAAQAREAVSAGDIFAGLFKSLVFAALIATAGCQAGLRSGRSSAAVGQATTRAVVNAIVYLVIADAALNILYDKLGI